MSTAPTDPATVTEILRRLPDDVVDHLTLLVEGAGPYDVVLYTHPTRRAEGRGMSGGTLLCRPVFEVIERIVQAGHTDLAERIASSPAPAGHRWVVWLGDDGALVAPWPSLDCDRLCAALVNLARPDFVEIAAWLRTEECSHLADEIAVIVGAPRLVEALTGKLSCEAPSRAVAVDRLALVARLRTRDGTPSAREVYRAAASALAEDVPPGALRLLVVTDRLASVATVMPLEPGRCFRACSAPDEVA